MIKYILCRNLLKEYGSTFAPHPSYTEVSAQDVSQGDLIVYFCLIQYRFPSVIIYLLLDRPHTGRVDHIIVCLLFYHSYPYVDDPWWH